MAFMDVLVMLVYLCCVVLRRNLALSDWIFMFRLTVDETPGLAHLLVSTDCLQLGRSPTRKPRS